MLEIFVFIFSSSLPELLEKKRLIDMHTNIATALLDQIKVRLKLFIQELKSDEQPKFLL